jgi:hypothetical protein
MPRSRDGGMLRKFMVCMPIPVGPVELVCLVVRVT